MQILRACQALLFCSSVCPTATFQFNDDISHENGLTVYNIPLKLWLTVRLPNADQANVQREKITEYLLSSDHPDGRSKARFFAEFGFRKESWEILAEALQKHGASHPVEKVVESVFGTRYTIEGELETPDGRKPRVRTVWIIEEGNEVPRLITAYPC